MPMKLKKDDHVMVISGKEKGKNGKIVRVLRKDEKVVVEGLNKAKRHTKPNRQNETGGIIEKEMPIHVSNVMLMGKSGKPVRISRRVVDGKRKRVESKSGNTID